jgi:phosphoenolpyruvate carboxykinase (ATP)
VLNTGSFMGKKVQPADTLGILEAIVEGKAEFKAWKPFEDLKILDWPGFPADLADATYRGEFKKRMADRLAFVQSRETELGGSDKLPADALNALEDVLTKLA